MLHDNICLTILGHELYAILIKISTETLPFNAKPELSDSSLGTFVKCPLIMEKVAAPVEQVLYNFDIPQRNRLMGYRKLLRPTDQEEPRFD